MPAVICALTLLSGVIGAGFASGREIVRFFCLHGAACAAAVACAACALVLFFLRLLRVMEREGVSDAAALCRARFGRRVGGCCAALFFALSAVTAGAMLAACAELCALVLPLRPAYGAGLLLTLALSLLLAGRGVRGLALAGAALIALLPVLLLRLLLLPAGEACFLPAMTPDLPVRAMADGVSYAALNAALLLGASPLLLSLRRQARRRGVLLFGLLFALLLSLGCAVCLRHLPAVAAQPMPFVALSSRLPGGQLLLAACMYAAALSTLVAMISSMAALLPLSPPLPMACAGLMALALSRLGFGALVQSAYPVLGAVCAGLMILLCV